MDRFPDDNGDMPKPSCEFFVGHVMWLNSLVGMFGFWKQNTYKWLKWVVRSWFDACLIKYHIASKNHLVSFWIKQHVGFDMNVVELQLWIKLLPIGFQNQGMHSTFEDPQMF